MAKQAPVTLGRFRAYYTAHVAFVPNMAFRTPHLLNAPRVPSTSPTCEGRISSSAHSTYDSRGKMPQEACNKWHLGGQPVTRSCRTKVSPVTWQPCLHQLQLTAVDQLDSRSSIHCGLGEAWRLSNTVMSRDRIGKLNSMDSRIHAIAVMIHHLSTNLTTVRVIEKKVAEYSRANTKLPKPPATKPTPKFMTVRSKQVSHFSLMTISDGTCTREATTANPKSLGI